MTDFQSYIKHGNHGFLIGIGGVSMSPLAEVLSGMGLHISGSDMMHSEKTEHLESLGINVKIGHSSGNISPNINFVVRTAAVHDDNPEIVEARRLNIPVFERAEAWGTLMRDYKNAICISGTHGKTTTTSMCTHILMAAEADPTVMIGGTLPLLKAGHRVGRGDTIVMESCEYHDAFLSFSPTVAVILDIEADHLDYFRDLEHIKNSFRSFALSVPADGYVVANLDDENTMDAIAGIDRRIFTYGLTEKANVYAKNIRFSGSKSTFDVWHDSEFYTEVTLHVPGLHNIKNALAATAASICRGIRPAAVRYGLAGFTPPERRFEFKGKFRGADVYDDYAHHPGELAVLIEAVKNLSYERIILVFQPHTFTRTEKFFDDFVAQLARVDVCYLAEIYAARELNTSGISSADLSKKLDNALFFDSFEKLESSLRASARAGDIILTVGAGDIYKVGEGLVE